MYRYGIFTHIPYVQYIPQKLRQKTNLMDPINTGGFICQTTYSLTDDTIYIDTSAIDWVVVEVVACTRMASGNG